MFTTCDLTPAVYDKLRGINAEQIKTMINEPCVPFVRLYSEDPKETYGDLLLGFYIPETEEATKVEFDVFFNQVFYCHHSLVPGEFVRACDDNLIPLIAMKCRLDFRISTDKPVYCVYANLPESVQKNFCFNPKNYLEHPLSIGNYVYYIEGVMKAVRPQRLVNLYDGPSYEGEDRKEYMDQLPTF